MRRLLIDANHVTGRCAGTGLSELYTTDGRPSGIIFGMFKHLAYLKSELKIPFSDMVLAWDQGRSAYRMELYPDYKGGRYPEVPTEEQKIQREEYIMQLDQCRELLPKLGVRQIYARGVEADDLLGVVASSYVAEGDHVIVSSGDYDIHQLSHPKIDIFMPDGKIWNHADILAKWELPSVDYIPLYKAIAGDSSDNIPGVRGLGPVKTMKILKYVNIADPWRQVAYAGTDTKLVDQYIAEMETVYKFWIICTIPKTLQQAVTMGLYRSEQMIEAYGHFDRIGENIGYDRLREFFQLWQFQDFLDQPYIWGE